MHPVTERVTQRIVERSRRTRAEYLARMDAAAGEGPHRQRLSCGNLAPGFAASGEDKPRLRGGKVTITMGKRELNRIKRTGATVKVKMAGLPRGTVRGITRKGRNPLIFVSVLSGPPCTR